MDKDIYYIVTEGGAPAVEEVPATGGKVAVVCERPDLGEEGETLEPINSSDLALLLDARTDVDYVRVRAPEGPRTIDKSEFSGDTVPSPRTGALTTRVEGLTGDLRPYSSGCLERGFSA